ncbi:MAG: T9SS type A sorting domain-containing protein [Cytophagaceae bacterium]
MKTKLLIFIVGFLFSVSSISNAQVKVSLQAHGQNIVRSCTQNANFNLVFYNESSSIVSNIKRRISLPAGLYISWDQTTLSTGISVQRINDNVIDIYINSLEEFSHTNFGYKIEAKCNFPAQSGIKPLITEVPGENDENSYIINASDIESLTVQVGSNGTVTFIPDYQVVNGGPVNEWDFSANTGTIFTRSYKLQNNHSSLGFSGYITFQNNLPASMALVKCEVLYYDGQNNIIIGDYPSSKITGNYQQSFKVSNLPKSQDIIITETIEVISCLSNGGLSTIKISNGCTPKEECTVLMNKSINTIKREGQPNFTVVPPSEGLPICVFGQTYPSRRVTFINHGSAGAINPMIYHVFDDLYDIQNSSTIIPLSEYKITVNKSSTGEVLVYQGEDLKALWGPQDVGLISYDGVQTKYAKCYTGEALYLTANTYLPVSLEVNESVTVEWTEIHCCPVVPYLDDETSRRRVLYQTPAVQLFYHEDCIPTRQASLSYPNSGVEAQRSDIIQHFEFIQSYLPYKGQMSGVNRSFDDSNPTFKNSGETTDIILESTKLVSSYFGLKWNQEMSAIEFEVELEDGLTLFEAKFENGNYNLTGQNYDFQLRNNSLVWSALLITPPAFSNSGSDDNKNEKWVFRFSLADVPITNEYWDLERNFIEFMNKATLSTRFRGVCTGLGNSYFNISMFLLPADDDGLCGCRLPVNTNRGRIKITCPGCITPGVVMGPVNISRMDFGAIDNNNNGIADELEFVSIPGDNRKKNFMTLGDRFTTSEVITFVDGNPGLGGFSYSQLNQDIIISDDEYIPGIFLDNLYVILPKRNGIQLLNSKYKWQNQDEEIITSSSIVKEFSNVYVIHIKSTELGRQYFIPEMPYIAILENEFKITGQLSADKEVIEVEYMGILTDRDLDILNMAEFPTFVNGSCNDRPDTYNCSSLLNDLKVNAYYYNHYCEPGNVASFLYIPIVHDNTAYISTSHPDIPKELCNEEINFRARYYHPGINSFPNEVRNYGSTIEFVANIPPDYTLTEIGFRNESPYYSAGTLYNSIDEFTITPQDSRWNYMINISPDPEGKGKRVVVSVNMEALEVPASGNNPHTDQIHWGDENLYLLVSIHFKPDICGPGSKDYLYFSLPYLNDETKTYSNVYPFMDLNYVTEENGGDYIFNIPDFNTSWAYVLRPETDLRLQAGGNTDKDIHSEVTCFNFVLENHVLSPDNIIPGWPRPQQIVNTKNSFLYFTDLPTGFEIQRLSRLNSNNTFEELLAIDNNLYDFKPIESNKTATYEICATFDCATTLNKQPFKIIYGYNCNGFPTIESILSNDNSVCFKGVQNYTLTSYPFDLSANAEFINPPLVCEESNYQLQVYANEVGEISDFEIEITFPEGYHIAEGQFKLDNLAFVPEVDIDNPRKFLFRNINKTINLGENFIIAASGTVTCDLLNNSKIKATIKASNYCGTAINSLNVETPVDFIVSPELYDDLNISVQSSDVIPGNTGVLSVSIVNNANVASSENNEISVILPVGLVFKEAKLNGQPVAPVVNSSFVKLPLPSVSANGSVEFEVGFEAINNLDCSNLSPYNISITGRAEVSCLTSSCMVPKVIVSKNDFIPLCGTCVLSVNAGNDKTICQGESTEIGTAVVSGYTYSWVSVPTGFTSNAASPIVMPQVTTTYILTVINDNGCSGSDEVLITVKPSPAVGITSDRPTFLVPDCNEEVVLTASGGTFASYQWYHNAGGSGYQPIIDATAASHTATEAGYYRVSVTNDQGCTGSAYVNVENKITLSGDEKVCDGEEPRLYVNVAGVIGPYTIQTIFDGFLPDENLKKARYHGILVFEVLNPELKSCTLTTANLDVLVFPLPDPFTIAAGGKTYLCSDLNETVDLIATPSSTYPMDDPAWTYAWNTGLMNQLTLHHVSASGSYYVTVMDNNGCQSTSNAVIVVTPTVYISKQCREDNTVVLTANVNVTANEYIWRDSDNNIIGTDWSVVVSEDGNYSVEIPGLECEVISSIEVCIQASDGNSLVINGSFEDGLRTCPLEGDIKTEQICRAANVPSSQWPGSTIITRFVNDLNNGLWQSNGGFYKSGNSERNFLLVDAKISPAPVKIWSQEDVEVDPCGTYRFTALIDNIIRNEAEIPKVWLTVNGRRITAKTTFPNSQPEWVEISGDWESNGSTTAVISIYIEKGGWVGRDISIDEIKFYKKGCSNEHEYRESPFIASVGTEKFICSGSSVRIGSNIVQDNYTYQWSVSGSVISNQPNPIVSPGSTTVYSLMITDGSGNYYTDEVTVYIIPPSIALSVGNDTEVCSGKTIQLMASGADNYKWTPASGLSADNISNPIASPVETTIYKVSSFDNYSGCFVNKEIKVTVNQSPVVEAGADKAICTGEDVQLEASGAAIYEWSPHTYLDNAALSNPRSQAIESIKYTVTGKFDNGCESSDDVQITVEEAPAPHLVFSGTLITASVDPGYTVSQYYWYKGSILLGSTIDNTFSIDGSGHYKVVVDYAYASGISCSAESNFVQVLIDGTAEMLITDGWIIYPQPAGEWVKVQLKSLTKGSTIEILDVHGKLVGKEIMHGIEQIISLEHLASGMYIIQLNDGQQLAKKKQLIIRK